MNLKDPWPIAAICVAGIAAVVVVLALHLDTAAVMLVISSTVFPIVGAALYGKMATVEQQTNGTNAKLQASVQELIAHIATQNAALVEHVRSTSSTPPDTTNGGPT